MFNFFNFFKSKPEEVKGIYNKKGKFVEYCSVEVQVRYEGEAISYNAYAEDTLLYKQGGFLQKDKLRENFNDQKSSLHTLLPHGFGKITYYNDASYDDDDIIYEEYEGGFHYGEYSGQGKVIFRTGEILEGYFEENKFIGKTERSLES